MFGAPFHPPPVGVARCFTPSPSQVELARLAHSLVAKSGKPDFAWGEGGVRGLRFRIAPRDNGAAQKDDEFPSPHGTDSDPVEVGQCCMQGTLPDFSADRVLRKSDVHPPPSPQ